MTKPIIGVLPLWDDEKHSIWMLPGYLEGIREASGLPVIFPLTDDKDDIDSLVNKCDGILFTGGQDVQPHLYNEKTINNSVICCPMRDSMELKVLSYAMEQEKPILGICRGLQFINVALGGTLYQDLPAEHPSLTRHLQTPPYSDSIHEVTLCKDEPLSFLIKKEKIKVNSLHHQAIKELAPTLKSMAISEDGLIESVYLPDYSFLWAVQWHPEFSYKEDRFSKEIFKSFTNAAKKKSDYRKVTLKNATF